MKICVNCKKELQDNAVFCSRCGTRQTIMEGAPKEKQETIRKKGRGKYLVIAGIVIALGMGGLLRWAYGNAREEWKESRTWIWSRDTHEYYYLKGVDYSADAGVYSEEDLSWNEDGEKSINETSRSVSYTDVQYDEKGRITARGLLNDTDTSNDVTYAYEDNEDGSVTLALVRYSMNYLLEEITQKYIFEYDANKECASKLFYGKKPGQIGYHLVSSETYTTLQKDGIYNRKYDWWETEDGNTIWLTKEGQKSRIQWIAELEIFDEEIETTVYCVAGEKKVPIFEEDWDFGDDRDEVLSNLREMFDNVGYNKKGDPEFIFAGDRLVELDYLYPDGRIEKVSYSEFGCSCSYEMFRIAGITFGPRVNVSEDEIRKEFSETYMEQHNLKKK